MLEPDSMMLTDAFRIGKQLEMVLKEARRHLYRMWPREAAGASDMAIWTVWIYREWTGHPGWVGPSAIITVAPLNM